MRQAFVYRKDVLAGTLTEEEGEYTFIYDANYLNLEDSKAISLTMPLQKEAFVSATLHPKKEIFCFVVRKKGSPAKPCVKR